MPTLLIIRHGLAEDFRPGLKDSERALTEEGWAKSRAAMQGLVRRGYAPTRGFHSPYRRAAETMMCLQEAASPFPMETSLGLLPGAHPPEVDLWLRGLMAEASPGAVLALISHQPLVSGLVFYLTGREVDMKKASCTVLTWENHGWQFQTAFSPSELRSGA